MSKQANEAVEEQYESLTRLARPGDWPRATDELEDNTSFAEGVIDHKVAHYYPRRNSHVKGHGWTFYEGTEEADYDYYLVCNDHSDWTAFGCSSGDYVVIRQSFETNPFMLRRDY